MEQDQEKDIPATEGDDAEGHKRHVRVEDAAADAAADDAEDAEGHKMRAHLDAAAAAAADDVEGHRITKK
jgi:hypothetical protein